MFPANTQGPGAWAFSNRSFGQYILYKRNYLALDNILVANYLFIVSLTIDV